MRTIIAGSRHFVDPKLIGAAVTESGFTITSVVCGGARGIDTLGERWAEQHGLPVARFPADWKGLGRRAGPLRNIQMAENADALIAVWDGKTRGTRHMIEEAQSRGLLVHVKIVEGTAEEHFERRVREVMAELQLPEAEARIATSVEAGAPCDVPGGPTEDPQKVPPPSESGTS